MPGNDLGAKALQYVLLSVFKDNVPETAPLPAFPGSACLAFQALLMNEVEGTCFSQWFSALAVYWKH